jgi:hypothetical protein
MQHGSEIRSGKISGDPRFRDNVPVRFIDLVFESEVGWTGGDFSKGKRKRGVIEKTLTVQREPF